MNERIKELAHQADFINKRHNGAEWRWGHIDPELNQKIEKFAELIVRECIDIVSPYAIRMENFDGGHPIADLKKHFGVEHDESST